MCMCVCVRARGWGGGGMGYLSDLVNAASAVHLST